MWISKLEVDGVMIWFPDSVKIKKWKWHFGEWNDGILSSYNCGRMFCFVSVWLLMSEREKKHRLDSFRKSRR